MHLSHTNFICALIALIDTRDWNSGEDSETGNPVGWKINQWHRSKIWRCLRAVETFSVYLEHKLILSTFSFPGTKEFVNLLRSWKILQDLGKILGKILQDVLVRFLIRSCKINKLLSPGLLRRLIVPTCWPFAASRLFWPWVPWIGPNLAPNSSLSSPLACTLRFLRPARTHLETKNRAGKMKLFREFRNDITWLNRGASLFWSIQSSSCRGRSPSGWRAACGLLTRWKCFAIVTNQTLPSKLRVNYWMTNDGLKWEPVCGPRRRQILCSTWRTRQKTWSLCKRVPEKHFHIRYLPAKPKTKWRTSQICCFVLVKLIFHIFVHILELSIIFWHVQSLLF